MSVHVSTKTQVAGPVAIKNVAAFMAMTMRLVDRDPHLPGIGVCSGYSGLGKTYASIFAQNKTRAIRVEVGDSWTRKTLLAAILRECERRVIGRSTVADLSAAAIAALGEDPARPLIIDEADKLIDKGIVEIVRELHEHSGAPVILIGEEALPTKLLRIERLHNRVLDWVQAQPCDLDDARQLARAFCPGLTLADDLLEHIRKQSGGRARRIVVNLAHAKEALRNRSGGKQLTLEQWGNAPLFTGKPPTERDATKFDQQAA